MNIWVFITLGLIGIGCIVSVIYLWIQHESKPHDDSF